MAGELDDLVLTLTDDRPAGRITVTDVDRLTHQAGVEIHLDPAHRRRGLATEALRHLVTVLLTPQDMGGWGLRRLTFTAAASNTAAVGLARTLRLRREVRARQDRWTKGVGLDDTLGWAVVVDEWDTDSHRPRRVTAPPAVGLGPHPRPWPDDPRLDPDLLREGDRRNVADRYRYWTVEAIAADLAARAHPFHVAVENWHSDFNIGTVVRNANAFGAAGVHIVGRRQWNKRGAMVTDRYLPVHHHDDIDGLQRFASAHGLALVGVDNLPGATSLLNNPLPRECMLLFGQEGPGLSAAAREAVSLVVTIPQTGSTRSINAGVASGVAMVAWLHTHARSPSP